MANYERIQNAVYDAIDEVNKQLPRGIRLEKSPDEALYGRSGKLESLDFVTLVMEVENKVQREFGVELMLTDEHLLSKEKSPFLTVGTLVEHLDAVLKEKATNGE